MVKYGPFTRTSYLFFFSYIFVGVTEEHLKHCMQLRTRHILFNLLRGPYLSTPSTSEDQGYQGKGEGVGWGGGGGGVEGDDNEGKN